ncbi:MAG: multiubiquitin domain-containing protein [Nitrosopumilus sp.]|nr:multiubiquitin domain-containing protein [Nitrosopumilus sp.]
MQKETEQCLKHFNIFVNARRHSWEDATIDYTQVVDLAFPPPHGPYEIFTVQYSRGPKENREGTLVEAQEVEVKNGMVFDVTRTDKS